MSLPQSSLQSSPASAAIAHEAASPPRNESRADSASRGALSQWVSLWAIGVGTLVLVGWSFDLETLKRVVPGFVAMNPVTALSFIACGASLWLLSRGSLSRRGQRVAQASAAIVALIGLLKLLEIGLGWLLGIDRWLFAGKLDATSANQLPNRMAPNTAFNFLLLGLALLLLDKPVVLSRRGRATPWWPFQVLAIVGVCASLLAVVGYAYGSKAFYGVGSFIPMALHTAITFLLLLMGVLWARPNRGMMAVVTSYSAGGVMARRLLPAAIVLPALLGWVRLEGERLGYYDGELGVSIFAVSIMLVFTILVWWNAQALFRTDAERQNAVTQMRQTSAELERANEELNKRNGQMESDLDLAGEIQQAFLPQQYINLPRAAPAPDSALRFHHRYLPASTLGGDFADILLLSETQAGVFICDVMGHGVRSALVTAVMRGMVEEQLSQSSDPGQFMTNLNRSLMAVLGRTKTPMFASALFLVADVESGTLRYANAGHPSPLHLHRPAPNSSHQSTLEASVEPLYNANAAADDAEANGPALGVFDDFTYVTRRRDLHDGDLLMLFTDGLFEVEGADEEFGEDRLQEAVNRYLTLSPNELFDAVLREVQEFSGGAPFEDDLCLVGMEVARLGPVINGADDPCR